MGDTTKIAWASVRLTDGTVLPGATWNPVTGCSHVSAGCEHCYAETLSLRRGWSQKPWTAPNAEENVVLHADRLKQPLHWRARRGVFVNSMSDLFHERIPDAFIARVFGAMASAPQHIYQVLTKRPERMRALVGSPRFLGQVDGALSEIAGWKELKTIAPGGWPLPNVWLGVSIEEDRWCSRADVLRATPAAVRFISAEPLLEPLPSLDLRRIDWLIFGGESGPGGRWMVERSCCPSCGAPRQDRIAESCGYCQEYPEVQSRWIPTPWALVEARRLRDLTHVAGGSYFLKQWGGPVPTSSGHLLDGREWREFPPVPSFPSDAHIEEVSR